MSKQTGSYDETKMVVIIEQSRTSKHSNSERLRAAFPTGRCSSSGLHFCRWQTQETRQNDFSYQEKCCSLFF